MKKIFLPLIFISIFFYSCSEKIIFPDNPYLDELEEFNSLSGFNAILIDDTASVNSAKRFQGHGDYPGVDDWFAVEINYGMVVLGGLPGQSAFYSIIKTYENSGGNKERYWKLLQVKPHPVFGYRPTLGVYQNNQKIRVAISKTLANSEYGEGGGWQLYISNYTTSLNRFAEISLSDTLVNKSIFKK
ncbi:MAG: hypothetical protein IAE65_08595 [Ignavibacteria bacterium]|nr:hypothetical protein [Ignavibacteria bacterium]HCN38286.1 hypothetical protein [Bacteroidota bacterium]